MNKHVCNVNLSSYWHLALEMHAAQPLPAHLTISTGILVTSHQWDACCVDLVQGVLRLIVTTYLVVTYLPTLCAAFFLGIDHCSSGLLTILRATNLSPLRSILNAGLLLLSCSRVFALKFLARSFPQSALGGRNAGRFFCMFVSHGIYRVRHPDFCDLQQLSHDTSLDLNIFDRRCCGACAQNA